MRALLANLALAALLAAQIRLDDRPVRKLIEDYFTAFEHLDADSVLPLWNVRAPRYAAQPQELKERMDKLGDARVKVYPVRKLDVSRDGSAKAVLRMDTRMGTRTEPIFRELEFRRAGDVWRIWNDLPAEEALAVSVAAANANQRRALVEESKDLMNARLCTALRTQANEAFLKEDAPRALELFDLSREIAERIGDAGEAAFGYNGVGIVHRSRKEYAEAVAAFRKRLELQKAAGNRPGMAGAFMNIAGAQKAMGELEPARESYQSALALAEELKDEATSATAHNRIGEILYEQNDFSGALDRFNRSLKGARDRRLIGQNWMSIAAIRKRQGMLTDAAECLQKAVAAEQESGYKPETAAALRELGGAQYMLAQYVEALQTFQKGLVLEEELGDRSRIAQTLEAMAGAHRARYDQATALAHYRKAQALYTEAKLDADAARVARAIAELTAPPKKPAAADAPKPIRTRAGNRSHATLKK